MTDQIIKITCSDSLKNLLGSYVGDIMRRGSNGKIKKTVGCIDVNLYNWPDSNEICIRVVEKKSINSCYLISNITYTYQIQELDPHFKNKQVINLKNNIVEERVEFKKNNSNDSEDDPILRWFERLTSTYWTYQFKFRNEKLHAFRVQEYQKFLGLTIIEISNITKLDPTEKIKNDNNNNNNMKSDWNF
jgi:hypothetical protein